MLKVIRVASLFKVSKRNYSILYPIWLYDDKSLPSAEDRWRLKINIAKLFVAYYSSNFVTFRFLSGNDFLIIGTKSRRDKKRQERNTG